MSIKQLLKHIKKYFDTDHNHCDEVCHHSEKKEQYCTHLKLIHEIASFCFWELDIPSKKIIFSSEITKITGKSLAINPVNLDIFIKTYIHPDYVIAVKKYFENIIKVEKILPFDCVFVSSDGIQKHIRILSHSHKNSIKGTIKISGIFYDITEWKEKETNLKERLDFSYTLMETIPNPIFYKDNNLTYKYFNNYFLQYFNYEKDALIDHNVYEICSKTEADMHNQFDIKLLQAKGQQSYPSTITLKDGTKHHVIYNKAAVLNENGTVKGIVGIVNNVTDQVESEAKIRRLVELKDTVLEINNFIMENSTLNELFMFILEKVSKSINHADSGCILLLREDNILHITASIGYSKEEVKNYSFKLEDSFQWKKTNGKIDKTIIINDIEKFTKDYNVPKLLNNKNDIPIKSTISTPIIIDNKLYGMLNIDSHENNVFDETDWAMMEYLRGQLVSAINKFKLYENITYLSQHDPKTGLYNRGYFEKLFEVIRERALRYDEKFLVVIFDLNGLKHVNDTFGHLAGDDLILYFSKTMKSWIRESDILARYGGDEFIAILFDANINNIKDRLEELRLSFENNPIYFEGQSIICSFSYGIAEFPYHGTNYDKLVEIADRNMYLYKGYLKEKML